MILIYLLVLCAVNIDGAKIGESCTVNGVAGWCQNIRLCAAAQEDIKNRKQPQLCAFHRDPIVCCPSDPTNTPKGTTRNLCFLPPYPENGHYVVVQGPRSPSGRKPAPGDSYFNYTLRVECDPGYRPSDSAVHTCYANGKKSNKLPTCESRWPAHSSQGEELPDTAPSVQTTSAPPPDVFDDVCGVAKTSEVTGRRPLQEVPWHAAIYTKSEDPYKQICGGSLVSETVVISAAECFWNKTKQEQLPASNYAVAVGKYYQLWEDHKSHEKNAQKSDVSEVKIPLRFYGNKKRPENDLALVIVSTPFKYSEVVRPVCLNFDMAMHDKQLAETSIGKVAGWGFNRKLSVLQVVNMPVYAYDHYKIRAGVRHNGTSTCVTDIGSGLSFREQIGNSSRYFLRGVLSDNRILPDDAHIPCGRSPFVIFTHLQSYEEFIRKTVPGNSKLSGNSRVPT